MDRNSAIGLTLIAVLLLVYFNFFAPAPEVTKSEPVKTSQEAVVENNVTPADQTIINDSVIAKQYGSLSTLLTGKEELMVAENDELRIHLSNKGFLREVELKKFKTYSQKPLLLASGTNNQFSLKATYEGKEVDLYQLYYTKETSKKGDTLVVTFQATAGNGSIRHIYSIPPSGYQVGYELKTSGSILTGKNISYQWIDAIPLQEKDIKDSRSRTTINFYNKKGEFNNLTEASTDTKQETLVDPQKWITIKQKFFLSSIIAHHQFSGGEVKTETNLSDSTTVKKATVDLFIPVSDVTSGQAKFSYYFGPNDYELLQTITEGFSKNLSLGWPPVSWVNKFVIIPIFTFLERFIGNYGIIIVLLVLFIKLILTPLSYKSYLGMAKMRLLKPELDAIKEKNGDNMTQAQQDQMKLYQQAGVNPFSGCIPLLLQMPILFAMFYFFPISIELRQQPFLWAEDLSTYDSIINLPFTIPFYGSHVSLFVLLMTASTLVYTWQNNQISSVQGPMKSMSYIMPVIFMFVLNSFSAGLSFYYFVSNLVTFAQQAIIKRFVDEDKIIAIMEENKKKAATGTGKKSKFMTKLEEAMKASEEARKKGSKK